MNLIDKAAVIAEIERRKSELQSRIAELGNFESNTLFLFQEVDLYDDILSFIDTLEVKEADFQIYIGEELEHFLSKHKVYDDLDIAKHFFELGLKVQKGE